MVAVDDAIDIQHWHNIYDVFRPQNFSYWVILKEVVHHSLNGVTSLNFTRMHSGGDDYCLLPII